MNAAVGGQASSRRCVVVTGAGRGIGRAVAERFLDLGDEVVAVGRSEGPLQELAAAHPGQVRVAACDVSDEAAVAAMIKRAGQVDVLVNNAGAADSAPLASTSLEVWNSMIAVNATSVFLCTRAVIGPMRERGSGRILTVASTAGRSGAAYASAYAAAKHAAIGLMRSAAAELAGTRVTANAVCPAFVDTEMTRESAARIAQRTGRSEEQSTQALADLAPLHRLVDPGEVAEAVAWLASPGAGAINGQAIVIDGGGIQT